MTSLCRLARILIKTHELDCGVIDRLKRAIHGNHGHKDCQNGHWGARRTLPTPAAGELGSADQPRSWLFWNWPRAASCLLGTPGTIYETLWSSTWQQHNSWTSAATS